MWHDVIEPNFMIPSAVFVLVVPLQTKFLLSSKFEKSWEYGNDVCPYFVYLEKAHSQVPREKLRVVLQEYGVDGRLLQPSSHCIPGKKCVHVGRDK